MTKKADTNVFVIYCKNAVESLWMFSFTQLFAWES